MRPYTPEPASVPDRALAYLRTLPHGAEVVSAVLAEGAHVPPAGLKANMQGPLNAGAVFVRQKGGAPKSPLFWSLVDHSRVTQPGTFPKSRFEAWKPRQAIDLDDALAQIRADKDASTVEAFSAAYGSQTPDGDAAIPPAKAGSETPQEGADRVPQVLKAEPETADATVGEARSKVMAPEGSDSPTGRGTVGAPAVSAAPAFVSESAHSLPTVCGGRSCSLGDGRLVTGDLTPASLNNGREQTKTVSGLPDHSAPELAPRKKGQPLTRSAGSQNVVKAEAARSDATDREIPANHSPVGGPTGAGQPAAAGPVWDRASQPMEIPQFITDIERGIEGMRAIAAKARHFEIGIFSDGRMVLEIGPDRYELTAAEQRKMAEFCVRCGQ